jgi:hypothetical protein
MDKMNYFQQFWLTNGAQKYAALEGDSNSSDEKADSADSLESTFGLPPVTPARPNRRSTYLLWTSLSLNVGLFLVLLGFSLSWDTTKYSFARGYRTEFGESWLHPSTLSAT